MSQRSQRTSTMARHENQYVREILHAPEPAPPIPARFFYTSPLAIDDPLSPLPPPVTGSTASFRHPPRPFSVYDNKQLDSEWLQLRKKLLKHSEEQSSEKAAVERSRPSSRSMRDAPDLSPADARRRGYTVPEARDITTKKGQSSRPTASYSYDDRIRDENKAASHQGPLSGSLRTMDPADMEIVLDHGATTGTPFIRAPSRRNVPRPLIHAHADSYNWAEDEDLAMPSPSNSKRDSKMEPKNTGPSAKVPVGVSRLHDVVMPDLQ